MRIEKLTLRGFLRFRDSITLDLTDVPEGLVAIVGPNGAGKTTLLEAAPAVLYRSFMSRGDVVDYATGRDSFLELQLAVEGHGTYRARVNVDGPKRTSDAVLEAVQPNGTRRVLNDGKVSTYDQAIARVFPSKDVLLASAFAAQSKAGSFITLDKKGRKALFAQLLGIERYETMAQTARQAATFAEQAVVRLEAQRDVLAQDVSDRVLAELDRIAQDLQVEGGRAELQQRDVTAAIASLEARLATMTDVVAAYGALTQRITTLRTERDSRRDEQGAVDADLARTRAQLLTDLERLTVKRDADLTWVSEQLHAASDLEARETREAAARADADRADLAKKITGNQQILGMAEQIRTAVAQSAAIDTEVAALEREALTHREAIDRGEAEHRQLAQRIAALGTTTHQLQQAHRDAGLLGSVPCGGTGAYAPCQFLRNATAAQARIPDLEQAVAELPALEAARTTVEQTVLTARSALAELHKRTVAHRALQAELSKLTKYAEPLAAAQARIAELDAQQATVARDFDRAVAAAHDRRDRRQAELLAQREQITLTAAADIDSTQARADAAVAQLQQRAATLAATVARLDDDLTTAEADLAASDADNQAAVALRSELLERRAERDRLIATLARVESGRQELDRRRAEIKAKGARLADLSRRVQRLHDELLDWQTLAKAFGRDGLPVLEIDAAGPTISAYTNQLLEVCFGPRFSVELVTQAAKADGKGFKEDFSIRVLDNQRGGEARDIADLSGGEQVIVAEALSNAICIYVNTRAVMPVRTCWRDETTGALDPENATRYIAMLRKVQELGGFAHVLFISHNPDAAAQADAQVQLADGAVSVVYPPYARAEAA